MIFRVSYLCLLGCFVCVEDAMSVLWVVAVCVVPVIESGPCSITYPFEVNVCPSMCESLGVTSHVHVSPSASSCETMVELLLSPFRVSWYLWFICAVESALG